ncbi:MAG: methylated-DNA--[protein]-cysteine S-methyltransferase [Sulfurospirillum sp.]
MLCFQKIKSPIEDIYLVANDTHLLAVITEISWYKYKNKFINAKNFGNKIIQTTHLQLDEYFAKKRQKFDLPISPKGTEFQKSAWKTLIDIPYGETISYEEQAKRAGHQKAIRAIGGANGANPIAIIIPCHRVIGKSGKLTGYASGLDIKQYLLKLESS